ncbi:MAG: hypothetical protein GY827_07225 [Cytophagales bacterium]|nr:hypothetical protein [Cytophagales bacterium]
MRIVSHLVLVCFFISSVSCHTTQATAMKKKKKYRENVQKHRKKYTPETAESQVNDTIQIIEPNFDQTAEVDSLLDKLSSEYKRYTKSRGYRILIYSGPSEIEAIKAEEALREIEVNIYGDTTSVFQDIPMIKTYQAPNFKVLVGNYIDKLLAHQMLLQIKDEFPNALLIHVNDVTLDNID